MCVKAKRNVWQCQVRLIMLSHSGYRSPQRLHDLSIGPLCWVSLWVITGCEFEFTHGFPGWVPLTFGQPSAQAPPDEVLDMGEAAISNQMKMRHWANADHMTTAQASLGHLLAKRI